MKHQELVIKAVLMFFCEQYLKYDQGLVINVIFYVFFFVKNSECKFQELIREVVNLRRSVEDQGKKITDLGNYIDTLVSSIIIDYT